MSNIKVGDIIDGKRVIKVFTICGDLAYQTEPVRNAIVPDDFPMNPPEEPAIAEPVEPVIAEPVKKTTKRRKKEV